MQYSPTQIPDVIVFEPKVFSDARGFFFESFREEILHAATGKKIQFVQENHSKSQSGVLRGLHYQLAPKAQGKLVRVVMGEVYDVAVDLRKNSPTFGQSVSILLSAENKKILWIPEGFAHGFCVLSEAAEFIYKTTEYYAPELERTIAWNDPQLNISWPLQENLLSEKDKKGLAFNLAEVF